MDIFYLQRINPFNAPPGAVVGASLGGEPQEGALQRPPEAGRRGGPGARGRPPPGKDGDPGRAAGLRFQALALPPSLIFSHTFRGKRFSTFEEFVPFLLNLDRESLKV